MAIYSYMCSNNHETELHLPMNSDHPKDTICEVCGEVSLRNFLSTKVVIPEHMKAQSDICGGDSYANFSNLKEKFSHGSRPSGRTGKIYY